jgi:hypothetical protein
MTVRALAAVPDPGVRCAPLSTRAICDQIGVASSIQAVFAVRRGWL